MAGFLPAATAWCAVLSLPILIWVRLPQGSLRMLTLCSTLNGAQSVVLALAIIAGHDATIPNVLYGCRGIWSVVLVYTIGKWLGLTEGNDPGKLFSKLVGATLILFGITATLLGGKLFV